MRTVNEEKFEAKKRHIREAALTCFRRSGFHGASMSDICAEARMSPGNLYRYYEGKEAIIEAICEHDREQVTRRLEAMRGRPNLIEEMLQLADESMRTSSEPGKATFACEIIAEAMRNERVGGIVRRHNEALLAICVEAIGRAQAMKLIDPQLDPTLAAALLIGAADGLGIRLALHPSLDAKRSIELFKLLITRFLRPPSP